ncbi:MAG TPA: hypothetical protein VMT67_03055 [Terriglobales bacterium]|nr:hypothetical protein [Terriglobales bacterium]
MNIRDIKGFSTTQELYEFMSIKHKLHAGSMDDLIRCVSELQARAIDQAAREAALDRMVANAEELGLYDEPEKAE